MLSCEAIPRPRQRCEPGRQDVEAAAGRVGVDHGAVAADDAEVLEPLDPVIGGTLVSVVPASTLLFH
jgi:hypothetical protein